MTLGMRLVILLITPVNEVDAHCSIKHCKMGVRTLNIKLGLRARYLLRQEKKIDADYFNYAKNRPFLLNPVTNNH